MSQGGRRGSKKGPATLAMAAVGAVGGIALARRRKAGAASEAETTPDPTLHLSSQPADQRASADMRSPADGEGANP